MSLFLDLPANARAGALDPRALSVARILATLCTARYCAAFLYRLSRRAGPLGLLVKQVNQFLTGADISPDAQIGPGIVFYHPNGVVIGRGVSVGSNCVLQQGVTIGGLGGPRAQMGEQPQLGDEVFVGAGARIIGGVSVGDEVVVGANAVVTKNIPAKCNAVGIPATWRPRNT